MFYPYGIYSSTSFDGSKWTHSDNISISDNNKHCLKLKFKVPPKHRDKVTSSSEIIVAIKIINDHSLGYPLDLNGKERYMGVKFNLGESLDMISILFRKEKQVEKVKILPLLEILNTETWK